MYFSQVYVIWTPQDRKAKSRWIINVFCAIAIQYSSSYLSHPHTAAQDHKRSQLCPIHTWSATEGNLMLILSTSVNGCLCLYSWSLQTASFPAEHHECDDPLLLQGLGGQTAPLPDHGPSHRHVRCPVWDGGGLTWFNLTNHVRSSDNHSDVLNKQKRQ